MEPLKGPFITPDGFIKIFITPKMISIASQKADELGELKNSIRHGAGNLTGFLGEQLILSAFPDAESCPTYHYDILHEGKRLEVKTKDRTSVPLVNYECSVSAYNYEQRADLYVFCSTHRRRGESVPFEGYILGYISPEEYKAEAQFLPAGSLDPSNGWKVSADCYNLPISKLVRFN